MPVEPHYTDAQARAAMLPEIDVPNYSLIDHFGATVFNWDTRTFLSEFTFASNFKVNTITVSRAVIVNSSNYLAASVTTSAELAFVSGVTSAIQTQLDNKSSNGQAYAAMKGWAGVW